LRGKKGCPYPSESEKGLKGSKKIYQAKRLRRGKKRESLVISWEGDEEKMVKTSSWERSNLAFRQFKRSPFLRRGIRKWNREQ